MRNSKTQRNQDNGNCSLEFHYSGSGELCFKSSLEALRIILSPQDTIEAFTIIVCCFSFKRFCKPMVFDNVAADVNHEKS